MAFCCLDYLERAEHAYFSVKGGKLTGPMWKSEASVILVV